MLLVSLRPLPGSPAAAADAALVGSSPQSGYGGVGLEGYPGGGAGSAGVGGHHPLAAAALARLQLREAIEGSPSAGTPARGPGPQPSAGGLQYHYQPSSGAGGGTTGGGSGGGRKPDTGVTHYFGLLVALELLLPLLTPGIVAETLLVEPASSPLLRILLSPASSRALRMAAAACATVAMRAAGPEAAEAAALPALRSLLEAAASVPFSRPLVPPSPRISSGLVSPSGASPTAFTARIGAATRQPFQRDSAASPAVGSADADAAGAAVGSLIAPRSARKGPGRASSGDGAAGGCTPPPPPLLHDVDLLWALYPPLVELVGLGPIRSALPSAAEIERKLAAHCGWLSPVGAASRAQRQGRPSLDAAGSPGGSTWGSLLGSSPARRSGGGGGAGGGGRASSGAGLRYNVAGSPAPSEADREREALFAMEGTPIDLGTGGLCSSLECCLVLRPHGRLCRDLSGASFHSTGLGRWDSAKMSSVGSAASSGGGQRQVAAQGSNQPDWLAPSALSLPVQRGFNWSWMSAHGAEDWHRGLCGVALTPAVKASDRVSGVVAGVLGAAGAAAASALAASAVAPRAVGRIGACATSDPRDDTWAPALRVAHEWRAHSGGALRAVTIPLGEAHVITAAAVLRVWPLSSGGLAGYLAEYTGHHEPPVALCTLPVRTVCPTFGNPLPRAVAHWHTR